MQRDLLISRPVVLFRGATDSFDADVFSLSRRGLGNGFFLFSAVWLVFVFVLSTTGREWSLGLMFFWIWDEMNKMCSCFFFCLFSCVVFPEYLNSESDTITCFSLCFCLNIYLLQPDSVSVCFKFEETNCNTQILCIKQELLYQYKIIEWIKEAGYLWNMFLSF